MRIQTTFSSGALVLGALLLTGCEPARDTGSSRAVDEKAIRDLVDRTVKAAADRDLAAYSKFYAPHASLVLPGVPISQMTGPLTRPFPTGYAIKMATSRVGFSQAGDFAYAFGTYEQTAPDRSGALANTVGKWMDVFTKQPDGSWGAVADTYNVDPPP